MALGTGFLSDEVICQSRWGFWVASVKVREGRTALGSRPVSSPEAAPGSPSEAGGTRAPPPTDRTHEAAGGRRTPWPHGWAHGRLGPGSTPRGDGSRSTGRTGEALGRAKGHRGVCARQGPGALPPPSRGGGGPVLLRCTASSHSATRLAAGPPPPPVTWTRPPDGGPRARTWHQRLA